MTQGTDDQSDNLKTSAPGPQARFKPLGSEALLGLAIAVTGSILGAMWYSMHEQFNRMDARFNDIEVRQNAVVEKINTSVSAASQLVNRAVDDATRKQYDNQVELLSKIDERLRAYDQEVHLEFDRLESALSVVEDINLQRVTEINDRLGRISDLILPAAGPDLSN